MTNVIVGVSWQITLNVVIAKANILFVDALRLLCFLCMVQTENLFLSKVDHWLSNLFISVMSGPEEGDGLNTVKSFKEEFHKHDVGIS